MSKIRYAEIKMKPRAFLALTSLTVDEFERLVPAFEAAFQAHMAEWRLDGKRRTKRSYTTYTNCPLPSAEDRLLFVLSYVKGNALQSNHGLLFGMAQGKTNSWLHTLLPVLRSTFRNLGLAPARSIEELAARLADALTEIPNDTPTEETAPPFFVTMAPNSASNVPKMRRNRADATAARSEPIP